MLCFYISEFFLSLVFSPSLAQFDCFLSSMRFIYSLLLVDSIGLCFFSPLGLLNCPALQLIVDYLICLMTAINDIFNISAGYTCNTRPYFMECVPGTPSKMLRILIYVYWFAAAPGHLLFCHLLKLLTHQLFACLYTE